VYWAVSEGYMWFDAYTSYLKLLKGVRFRLIGSRGLDMSLALVVDTLEVMLKISPMRRWNLQGGPHCPHAFSLPEDSNQAIGEVRVME